MSWKCFSEAAGPCSAHCAAPGSVLERMGVLDRGGRLLRASQDYLPPGPSPSEAQENLLSFCIVDGCTFPSLLSQHEQAVWFLPLLAGADGKSSNSLDSYESNIGDLKALSASASWGSSFCLFVGPNSCYTCSYSPARVSFFHALWSPQRYFSKFS